MWVYVLTDLAGNEVSELPGAYDKVVVPEPIGTLATAGLKVPLDHADADFMLDGDALLKVYETDVPDYNEPVLRFHGRLVSAEEVAGSEGKDSVAAAFADGLWTLLRRLCGKSSAGYSRGTALAPVDRGVIITDLVDTTNAESPSGVRMGTVEASSSTYVFGWYYAKIAEKIAELAATLDGPDYRIRPTEWESPGYYGRLDVAPAFGSVKLDAAFEYGDGLLNVTGYKRAVSLEGTINRAYNLPPGFPDNAGQAVLSNEDAGSIAARGLLEDVVPSDLSVDELRVKLLAHHIAIRARARQVITFTPVKGLRGLRYGVDYANGDVVPFRASVLKRSGLDKRIDALFRIYQTSISVDELGVGTPTLTVTPS